MTEEHEFSGVVTEAPGRTFMWRLVGGKSIDWGAIPAIIAAGERDGYEFVAIVSDAEGFGILSKKRMLAAEQIAQA